MEERRVPQGFAAQAAQVTKTGAKSIFDWMEKRKIAAHIVMAITLTLTVRIVEWAMDVPTWIDHRFTGTDTAAIIAAVLTPWGLMQGAMLKFYYDLIRSNGESKS